MSLLRKSIVLKLNAIMMPVYYETPMKAFKDMAGAPALNRRTRKPVLPYVGMELGYIPLDEENHKYGFKLDAEGLLDKSCIQYYQTYEWDDWCELPIRTLVNMDTGDEEVEPFVSTAKQRIRVPHVIVAQNYDGTYYKISRFSKAAVRERDKLVCQYTGKLIAPDQGDIEHVIPLSKGGPTNFENCVWASKDINRLKGDMDPKEFEKKHGYRLIRPPTEPKTIPIGAQIKNQYRIREWDPFILKTVA